jgi:hypothetical protein
MSDQIQASTERELLRLLAEEGAARCCYMPGAGNPEAWPTARCDCKYLPMILGGMAMQSRTGEQTGCCEIRAAYRVVLADARGVDPDYLPPVIDNPGS